VDADEERSLLAERFGIVLDGPPGPIWVARSAGATA
jgi:hypothetical protein